MVAPFVRLGGIGADAPVFRDVGAIQWISAVSCLASFRSCPPPTLKSIPLPVAKRVRPPPDISGLCPCPGGNGRLRLA
jgi:hypothetical protein